MNYNDLFGKTIEEASKLLLDEKVDFRAAAEDGRHNELKSDYRIGRINLFSFENIIVGYEVEDFKEVERKIPNIIGKPFSEVKKILKGNLKSFRVVSEDGNNFIITRDYIRDRYNLSVNQGIVTSFKMG